jgi:hypothetical protein
MEDVLEVYHRPYDAARPVVCMDECSKQLIGEVRAPLPPKPGHVAKQDSEYERRGTANVFMAVEPLAGQRTTQVTERRTRVDWARFVQLLLLTVYPLAQKVVLVMDNLNTHGIASLYEAFAPEVARAGGPVGTPLHTQAWELAQHGGNGTERSRASMPGSPHRRPRVDGTRGHAVASGPQCCQRPNKLAIQDRRRPDQAETALSIIRGVTEH